ncbi:TrkH family potassium uptake protein [Galbibacter mesophilus]|uniref:TrkH family potassium uptake protein n=1 Tax=Galbibacter mesophilus TaxID=379069 RepID=UPI00191E1338|nr:potassium transporter TrkG [Galbibacter mesophilus]MCM5662358.1 potassium transporter [Galbibacter mesophilus]
MKKVSQQRLFFLLIDFIVISFLIFDFGFIAYEQFTSHKLLVIAVIIVILLVTYVYRYKVHTDKTRKILSLTYACLFGAAIFLSAGFYLFGPEKAMEAYLLSVKPFIEGALLLYLIMRLSILIRYLYSVYFNPAILFVGSFFIFDLLGAFLLMLPKATTSGQIDFINALFTSTSAVCVTGLAVLDTSADFTLFGQGVILFLIQLGGLGILTFTSFFAYFFKGGSSFKESLYVKDYVASETLKDALKFAMNIVLFTFAIELVGAIFIYLSIEDLNKVEHPIFFSIFHAISAFCNAGFSNMGDGLFNDNLRFDYPFQWVIMLLVIIGGLGYNIIFNFYNYLKIYVLNLFNKKHSKHLVRLLTLNSKLVMATTVILLVAGFVFFYFSEGNNTLSEHQTLFGKITATAFQSVTPRTAGFNTINYAELTMPSLLFVILLMWIGGSPASTAGGIKTTTFALATLNIFNIARNRKRIEIGTRSISNATLNRAFAIVSISLITIGIAIILLLFFEPQLNLISVAFEAFSAYSTVGLSLNLTPSLSNPSKIVITVVMFIGRIGMLNILVGVLRQMNNQFYEYPKENILIN